MGFPLIGAILAGVNAIGNVVSGVEKQGRLAQKRAFVNQLFDSEIEETRLTLARINDSSKAILSVRGVGLETTEAVLFENARNAQKDIDNLNLRRKFEMQNIEDEQASTFGQTVFGAVSGGLSLAGDIASLGKSSSLGTGNLRSATTRSSFGGSRRY